MNRKTVPLRGGDRTEKMTKNGIKKKGFPELTEEDRAEIERILATETWPNEKKEN